MVSVHQRPTGRRRILSGDPSVFGWIILGMLMNSSWNLLVNIVNGIDGLSLELEVGESLTNGSFPTKTLAAESQPNLKGPTPRENAKNVIPMPQVVQRAGAGLARAFPVKDIDVWCTKEGYKPFGETWADKTGEFEMQPPRGLLYVKVPKAASSTLAGVINRISANHGDCDYRDQHTRRGAHRFYGNRVESESFLLGSIRDPAARAMSRVFFYYVSQHGEEPTDENVFKWLNETDAQFGSISAGQGGFQLKYLTTDKINAWSAFDKKTGAIKNPEKVEANVRQVVEKYDFIVVVERMDESLVALQMLMGVDIGDMLSVSSKVQGSYYYTGTHGCIITKKTFISPGIKEYLTSDLWYDLNYGDYLLHAAASESLDRTIDVLGRERFEKNLAEFRRLQALVDQECVNKAFFKCSAEGVDQREKMNCYQGDHGCGYPCIDDLLQSEKALA